MHRSILYLNRAVTSSGDLSVFTVVQVKSSVVKLVGDFAKLKADAVSSNIAIMFFIILFPVFVDGLFISSRFRESPRVFRRVFGLSQATMADSLGLF